MTTPEIISAAKDIVTIITLLIGSGVTLYGISTWRKQLTAKVDYELAKRIIITIYDIRGALEKTLFIFEVVYEDKEEKKRDIDKYCDKVEKLDVDLSFDLLEGNAMWGDQAKYTAIIHEFTSIQSHITISYGKRGFVPLNFKEEDLSVDDDLARLYKAVQGVEDILRPKLRYK